MGGNHFVQEQETFDEDDYSENELPADASIKRIGIYHSTNQFAAMDHWRPEYAHVHKDNATLIFKGNDKDIKGYTHEEGNFEQDSAGNVGVSEFDSHIDDIDRELSVFIETVKILRVLVKERGWVIHTRRLDGHLLVSNEVVTTFPEFGNKRRTWHKIDMENGVPRPRQVVWVELQ